MFRFLSAATISLAFLLPTLINSSHSEVSGIADEVLKQTNRYRKSNGLPPLVMKPELSRIALKHSEAMATNKRSFGHSGFQQRVKEAQKTFPSCTMAENVSYGAQDGKEAVDQWIGSAPHRKNLLGDYRYIGIGIATNKYGRKYYTQLFVR